MKFRPPKTCRKRCKYPYVCNSGRLLRGCTIYIYILFCMIICVSINSTKFPLQGNNSLWPESQTSCSVSTQGDYRLGAKFKRTVRTDTRSKVNRQKNTSWTQANQQAKRHTQSTPPCCPPPKQWTHQIPATVQVVLGSHNQKAYDTVTYCNTWRIYTYSRIHTFLLKLHNTHTCISMCFVCGYAYIHIHKYASVPRAPTPFRVWEEIPQKVATES